MKPRICAAVGISALAVFVVALLSENVLPDWGVQVIPQSHAAEIKILAATVAALATFWFYLGPLLAWGAFGFWVAFAWTAEALAIHTGWPAGHYSYSSEFPGPQVWGTPVLLGFQYYCYYFFISYFVSNLLVDGRPTSQRSNSRARVLFASFVGSVIVAGIDMMADPVQVHFAGQWSWPADAAHNGYYGIPLANYLGYLLIFTVALFVFRRLERRVPAAGGGLTPWLALIPLTLYIVRYLAYAAVAPDGVPLVGLFTMVLPWMLALDRLRTYARTSPAPEVAAPTEVSATAEVASAETAEVATPE